MLSYNSEVTTHALGVLSSYADAVQCKIDYLKTMKKLLTENKTQEAFIEAMKKAYPNLPGADGLGELAKALYK